MIRNANMDDAKAILKLINKNAEKGLLKSKTPYAIYKTIPNFLVWEENNKVVGCCRLSIAWKDIAEVASLAVSDDMKEKGIGKALVNACINQAKELRLERLFTFTVQEAFFKKCGFKRIDKLVLPNKLLGDCQKCHKAERCDEHAMIFDI